MQPAVALLHPCQKGGIDLCLHLSEALAEVRLGRSMALVPEGKEFRCLRPQAHIAFCALPRAPLQPSGAGGCGGQSQIAGNGKGAILRQ